METLVLTHAPASGRPSPRGLVLAGFVFAAAFARLLPHPPNVTPVGALALFGGACFVRRRDGLVVPLAAMLLSDLALAAAFGHGFGCMRAVVYGCVAATSLLGMRLRRRPGTLAIAGHSVLAATLFFVVTNFAVWLGGRLYPPTPAGLLACYTAALPFYANMLAANVVYGLVLFGGFAWLGRRSPVLQPLVAAP
jgi:hypothetical protein